jgi:hypothetical protein
MKCFLIVAALLGALPATEALAASVFPWFHTRPKPVFLNDESTAKPVSVQRVPYHGAAVYPASGRLYFADSVDNLLAGRQSRLQTSKVLAREWRNGSPSQGAEKSTVAKTPAEKTPR